MEDTKVRFVVKRLESRHCSHRRAVRVGDDPLRRVVRIVRVDLAHDERAVHILAPCGGVVHHRRAGLGEHRSPLTGHRATGGEHGDVDAAERFDGLLGDVLNLNVLPLPLEGLPRRAGGGEETHLISRELAFLQNRAHHAPNLPGSTNNSNSGHSVPSCGINFPLF